MADGAGKEAASGSVERKKNFLVVVDGNPRDRYETGMLLQRLEYNVFTTGTAEEAGQYMDIAMPSLVVTEMLLPAMNGMEFVNRIKQAPRTKNVPVVVLSQMKDPKIEELCMVAGCASYLRKPVDPNTLYRTVQHAIEATPRHYIRLNTCFKAVIGGQAAAGSPDPGGDYVTALSENGLFIRTYHPRPLKAVLPVTFFMQGRQVNVQACVLYAFTSAGGPLKEPGMGMKFIEISDADREFIRAFIRDQVTN
ncbi:MAG TPA: response regulator [Nitrospirota bacterium]|nr:response regulator [Nitrospirota bacterium]